MSSATETRTVSSIPAWELSYVKAKVSGIARRATKLGMEPPRVEVLREWVQKDEIGGYDVPMLEVAIVGQRPVFEGWEVLANLVRVGEENLVRCAEGSDLDERYRRRHVCDHCGTKRSRNETWVLRNVETGEIKQVARSCMKDFVGDVTLMASTFVTWRSMFSVDGDLEEEFMFSGHGGSHVSTVLFLGWACKLNDEQGYVSRKRANAEGIPTTGDAAWQLSRMTAEQLTRHDITRPSRAHFVRAYEALTWARDLKDVSNDYLYNCRVAAQVEVLEGKRHQKLLGFLASIVGAAYPRHLADEAKKAETSQGEYVGQIKDKLDFLVTIESVRLIDSEWGTSTFVNMVDVLGNKLVWKASGDKSRLEDKIGHEFEVRGTVKAHRVDRFSGQKTTYLTRCSFAA